MQRAMLVSGLASVTGKPRLQVVMIFRQPAGKAPHIDTIGKRGHKGQTLPPQPS
jgi:hypothetical protein